MLKIWRGIRLFEITEQRLADQTKVIRWLPFQGEASWDSEKEQGRIWKSPGLSYKTHLRKDLIKKLNVELMNIENVLSGLQNQDVTDDQGFLS